MLWEAEQLLPKSVQGKEISEKSPKKIPKKKREGEKDSGEEMVAIVALNLANQVCFCKWSC